MNGFGALDNYMMDFSELFPNIHSYYNYDYGEVAVRQNQQTRAMLRSVFVVSWSHLRYLKHKLRVLVLKSF